MGGVSPNLSHYIAEDMANQPTSQVDPEHRDASYREAVQLIGTALYVSGLIVAEKVGDGIKNIFMDKEA